MYPLHKIISFRLSLAIAIVMAVWAALFYFVIMKEVRDGVDDALEDYAEVLLLRSLRGEELPKERVGRNNQYALRQVSESYAKEHQHVRYEDREVFVRERGKEEPVRVFSQIFLNADDRWIELEVSMPTFEKEDLLNAIVVWLCVLYCGVMLAVFILNYFGIRRATRPIRLLLRWLDNYRLGTKNESLNNPTNIQEFRRLNESAEQTMKRIEVLHEQQRQFLGNASHELQTPLAVCQNRIELLLDDETLSEHQIGELLKMRRTMDGLSRLNRSLLLLCKIESGRFSDVKPISFDGLVSRILPDYEELYAGSRVHAKLKTDVKAPFWNMDESLAEALVTNLIRNAYLHNRPGGMVSVELSENAFVVRNTGRTDEPLDPENVFQRFYHTGESKNSTGLGLPIVRAICEQSGLKINYAFVGGMHEFMVVGENNG